MPSSVDIKPSTILMGSTTVLRGFRVSVPVLDAFLVSYGVDETEGTPPLVNHHPNNCPISILLHKRITKAGGTASRNIFRVMIPEVATFDVSRVAYATYAWASVYAHRELRMDEDLREEVPEGFGELRREILSFGQGIDDNHKTENEGKMGIFGVNTEIWHRGGYIPQALEDRKRVGQLV